MQPQVDNKVQDTTIVEPVQEKQVLDNKEIQDQNWRKFREVREQERKQKQESDRIAEQKSAEAEALKKAMEAILNKPTVQNQSRSNDQEDMTEDQRIEAKIEERFRQRQRQEEQSRLEREQADAPHRLKREYRDFDQVCSQQNLDYVEYHYPEVANAFNGRPDTYEKWVDIYKAVKRFVPNTDSVKDERKVENNLKRPQSMSVSGVSQTGDSAPQKLDDKRRADNWARMQRVIKGG